MSELNLGNQVNQFSEGRHCFVGPDHTLAKPSPDVKTWNTPCLTHPYLFTFQYKSPSGTRLDYPLYGTLNWGLTPTIIYKTPEPDISWEDVGDDYMKCSISAGNVELLTPPPANYKKLLRRSRRRMERRSVKRRRIYFESMKCDNICIIRCFKSHLHPHKTFKEECLESVRVRPKLQIALNHL